MATKRRSAEEWVLIRKGCFYGCLIPLSVAVLLIVGCGMLARHTSFDLGILTISFKQNPGSFDRKRMEAIVEAVRHAPLTPGKVESFVLEKTPGTIHRPTLAEKESYFYGPYVSALVSPAGDLKAVIVTRNLGHAGSYGFAYSDLPWKPEPSSWGGGLYEISADFHVNLCTPDMKIDDHWWKVENNLD